MYCKKCLYNLQGLPQAQTCPECGQGFNPDDPQSAYPDLTYKLFYKAVDANRKYPKFLQRLLSLPLDYKELNKRKAKSIRNYYLCILANIAYLVIWPVFIPKQVPNLDPKYHFYTIIEIFSIGALLGICASIRTQFIIRAQFKVHLSLRHLVWFFTHIALCILYVLFIAFLMILSEINFDNIVLTESISKFL